MTSGKKSDVNIKKFRKKEVLKVPENYFEEFNYKMQLKISANSKEVSWLDKFIYLIRLRFTVPFLIVCAISILVIQFELDTQTHLISDSSIENYLMEEFEYTNLEDLVAIAEFNFEEDNILIKDTDIIDYLETLDIEDELLYNQIK